MANRNKKSTSDSVRSLADLHKLFAKGEEKTFSKDEAKAVASSLFVTPEEKPVAAPPTKKQTITQEAEEAFVAQVNTLLADNNFAEAHRKGITFGRSRRPGRNPKLTQAAAFLTQALEPLKELKKLPAASSSRAYMRTLAQRQEALDRLKDLNDVSYTRNTETRIRNVGILQAEAIGEQQAEWPDVIEDPVLRAKVPVVVDVVAGTEIALALKPQAIAGTVFLAEIDLLGVPDRGPGKEHLGALLAKRFLEISGQQHLALHEDLPMRRVETAGLWYPVSSTPVAANSISFLDTLRTSGASASPSMAAAMQALKIQSLRKLRLHFEARHKGAFDELRRIKREASDLEHQAKELRLSFEDLNGLKPTVKEVALRLAMRKQMEQACVGIVDAFERARIERAHQDALADSLSLKQRYSEARSKIKALKARAVIVEDFLAEERFILAGRAGAKAVHKSAAA